MADTRIASASYHAHQANEYLIAAYWAESDHRCLYLLQQAVDQVAALSTLVTEIWTGAPPAVEAAE